MDEAVKVILKKLDDIDSRLKTLETGEPQAKAQPVKVEKDSFIPKALQIMDKYDEISAVQLQEALKIDKTRAEKLLDELEMAGYGNCYWKEV